MDKFPTLNPFNRTLAAASALLTCEPYYGLREKPLIVLTGVNEIYLRPISIPCDVTSPSPMSAAAPTALK